MPYVDIEKRRKAARESYYRNKHKLDFSKIHANSRTWRAKLRLKVIDFYTKGKRECFCCGENELIFLTVDHINNNGTKMRKLHNAGGHHNYRYIIKNNFPKGYQILCYNCNCGRARTEDKICPHEKKK